MRDYLPDALQPRLEVARVLCKVFELYGFQPLETPALERLDVLSGKYGEEGEKLSFRVMKRGAELGRALEKVAQGAAPDELADMGLRYDLTVPLARVVAQYGSQLPRPFKRYQIGEVWRADRPQAGRYRQFTQCDVDIVGTDSVVADREILCLIADSFSLLSKEFHLTDTFVIRINHRGLLKQFSTALGNSPLQFRDFCIALDKLDKTGRDGVIKEMRERGLKTENLDNLWDLTARGNDEQSWNQIHDYLGNELGNSFDNSLYENLRQIVWHNDLLDIQSSSNNIRIDRDFTLARGLDYYTGVIFEVIAEGKSIGSLGGGGRYDELIGMFSKNQMPAIGTSFGLDRIVDLLTEESGGYFPKFIPDIVIIELFPENEPNALATHILKKMREEGLRIERSYSDRTPLKRQIPDAVKRGSKFVIFVDENHRRAFGMADMASKQLNSIAFRIKHLQTGEQRDLNLNQAVKWIKSTQN